MGVPLFKETPIILIKGIDKKMQCKVKAFRFNRTYVRLNFPSTRLHKFSLFTFQFTYSSCNVA